MKHFNSQKEYMQYVRDVSHVHSKATGKLMNLALSYIEDAIKQEDGAKKIVWMGQAGDAPIVYASGAIPVSYIELTRLGTKKAIDYVEEELQIPGDVCSMVKIILGEFALIGKDKVTHIQANTGICEPYNLAFELLEKQGFPILYQDTPLRLAGPSYTEELYDTIYKRKEADLQEISRWISGKAIDENTLESELVRYNRILKKVNKINELRKKHQSYLANLPSAYIILGIGNYFGKPEQYEEVLDQFIEELSSLPEGAYDTSGIPLLWSGARSVDFGICQALDEAGGIIFDWNVATGLHQYFDETVSPIQAVVEYSLGKKGKEQTQGMGLAALEQMIKDNDAKGIIFYNYMGCPMCAVNTNLMGGYVKEQLQIPYLSLDGSFPTEPPSGQLLTRMEAFMEMLA